MRPIYKRPYNLFTYIFKLERFQDLKELKHRDPD